MIDRIIIIGITWTVYGKIASITKSGAVIRYVYDAAGNRIMKQTAADTTVYTRDASGNVLSVYSKAAAGTLQQTENHLYGSSRLGMTTQHAAPDTTVLLATGFGYARKSLFIRGAKLFELSNHLGNVLVTVTDRRQQSSAGGVNVNNYVADIANANDYYPFGMIMPGRKYAFDDTYRYGFNGKENDNDVKGEGNQQDYGMRIYDPRLGRFLSVDPLIHQFPFYTPYQFAGNSTIENIDLDGAEDLPYGERNQYGEKQVHLVSVKVLKPFRGGGVWVTEYKPTTPAGQPATNGMSDKDVYRLVVKRMISPGEFRIPEEQYLDKKYFEAEDKIKYYFSHHATATMSKGPHSDKLTAEIHNSVVNGLFSDDDAMSGAAVTMIDRRTSFLGKFNWAKTAVEFGVGTLIARGLKLAITRFASMGNAEVRLWYNQQLAKLNTKVAFTEENAKALSLERNSLKIEARLMMKDREAAKALDKTDPIREFEYYVNKYTQDGYTGERLWEKIITGSAKPNAAVNEKFGIK